MIWELSRGELSINLSLEALYFRGEKHFIFDLFQERDFQFDYIFVVVFV